MNENIIDQFKHMSNKTVENDEIYSKYQTSNYNVSKQYNGDNKHTISTISTEQINVTRDDTGGIVENDKSNRNATKHQIMVFQTNIIEYDKKLF